MKAVGYCRFSSEGQRDGYSIEAQQHAITEYAKKSNIEVIAWYVDEARSGTSDDRKSFQLMIQESEKKRFQVVIVHKLDRFSRNRYDSAVYKKRLKDSGVQLMSVLENLDGSPESIVMESLLEGMAEYYSENLSREVLKGKRESALLARHPGGKTPYGLSSKKDGTYEVVKDEALIIQDIFNLYNSNHSAVSIAKELNSKGLRNREGNKFDRSFVARAIKNPLYKGQFVYGRRSNKLGENIVIDDAFEAIVSKDIYDRAQTRLAKMIDKYYVPRSRSNYESKLDEYMLTGYIYCGHCASHLFGFQSKRKHILASGEEKVYSTKFYRCAHKPQRFMTTSGIAEKCQLKNVYKDKLEEFVVKAIENIVFSDEHMYILVKKLKVRLAQRIKNSKQAEVSKEIEKIKKQQGRLLELYLNGGIEIPVYTERKNELDKSLIYYIDKYNTNTPVKAEDITFERVTQVTNKFLNSIEAEGASYKKLLISLFLHRIELNNEQITMYFNFPLPGLNPADNSCANVYNLGLFPQ